MTALERRKLFCSVTFHIVAITCVIWSLYVLIDRTYQEIRDGEPLQWPFWTKLIVVAIGFTGGLVFMYIQCKVYVHLCKKWKAYNRIIVVQVKSGPQFWAGKCKLIFFSGRSGRSSQTSGWTTQQIQSLLSVTRHLLKSA